MDLLELYELARELRLYGLAYRIKREIQVEVGRYDRKASMGCRSSNGSYLDGWYDPDGGYLNVTSSELSALVERSRNVA